MNYLLYIVTVLYALLSMMAAGTQLRTEGKKDAPALMIVGGALLLLTVGAEIMALFDGWPVVTLGGALICAAAFLNGQRSGSFHLKHHIVRFVVTLLLVAGFYFF